MDLLASATATVAHQGQAGWLACFLLGCLVITAGAIAVALLRGGK
jgi:hypothetical protein